MADIKEGISGLQEKTAGAAPVDANQRPSSAHSNARSSTSNKGNSGTLHWFAYIGNEADSLQNERVSPGKEPSGLSPKEREERIRALRDRQNEERQRKLEELKQQALAAQKFREQKEEERRRRIEELRQRDNDRRHQVEERKRQIWEAERDRREAILRKNQRETSVNNFQILSSEREARIDSKRKNERSSIVFAFGSSTPRMLEPADTGGSFWGTRRATSTTNVMMLSAAPLTRRSSERELDGSKKRATSASGLDRKPGEDMKMSSSMYEVFHWNSTPEPTSKPTQRAKSLSYAPGSEPKTTPDKSDPHRTAPEVPTELNLNLDGRAHSFSSAPHTPSNRSVRIGNFLPGYGGFPGGEETDSSATGAAAAAVLQRVNRRKTDLMPTIPSPRDLTPTSSSRPSSVYLQGNRPFSRSPGLRSGEVTPSPPSRPLSALSQQSMNSVNSGVSLRARPAAASRRPRPFSIAVTGVSHESDSQATRTSHRHSIAGDIRTAKTQSSSIERENAKPPLPKVHSAKKPKSDAPMKKSTDKVMKSAKASPRVTPKATPLQSPGSEAPPPLSLPQEQVETKEEVIEQKEETEVKTEEVSPEKLPDTQEQVVEVPKPAIEVKEEVVPIVVEVKPPVKEEEPQKPVEVEQKETKPIEPAPVQEESLEKVEALEKSDLGEPEVDMSASMIEKIRNRTEDEAKAALAERRRLAREQAEREAELERQRLEEEKRLEEERLRQEEEEQRRFEEEQLRLVEDARKAEEERLLQAIEENERREEEERKRREEEAKARAEKEESERKAREEAERLRREMDERLKKEEEERIARRKRVEAIMLRTRGKGSTPSNASAKGDGDNEEGKDESPMEETKPHPGDGAEASGETQQPSSNVEDAPAQSTLPATSDNITGNGQISQKQQSLLTDAFSSNIMDHIQENGGSEKKVSSSSSSDLLLIDNSNNIKPMETSEDLISSATSVLPPPPQLQQSNGHRNGMEYGAVDFVSVDNVKQNNATNNLLDFSEFDAFSTNNVMMNATQPPTAATNFEQILDLSSVPTTGKLSNEDNVNSNVMNNGPAPPFIAFQDNLAKKTDTNSVTDLLS